MSPQVENEDIAASSVSGVNQRDPALPNIVQTQNIQKKEEPHQHPLFSSLFMFLCGFAVLHYIFSIVYTYVYYPPIWRNVIEGYMEDFGLLPPNPARNRILN